MSGTHPSTPDFQAAEHEQLLAQARALFDLASESIFIADLNGRFTEVNASACKMLGYAREELLGKAIVDVIPPEDIPRLAATREHLLSPGSTELGEWTLLRNGGTPIPVEISAKILPDGRWQAFVRDISERKRIELALQQSEEQFRLMFDEAPIGMALVALDGRFVRVNRSLCEIVGYPAAELERLSFQAITHPDDLDVDLGLAGRLARGDIPRYQLEKRYIRKDGTPVDIMLSASMLRNRDGAPRFYIVQIEDVTDRKRTEKELHDVNASLDAIIENVPLMLFVKESESLRFVRMNRAGQELLGWTKENLVGKNDYEFWPHAQAHFFIEKDRETLERGKVLEIDEEPIQTRHQGVRVLHTRKVPVLDKTGKPLFLLGISEDITERRRAEAALRQSESQFRGLIEHMPDGVMIYQGGRIVYANDAFSKLLGYDDPTAILGQTIDDLYPPDVRPIVADRIRIIQQTGLAVPPRELRAVRRDGSLCDIETVALQVQFQGEPGIIVVIRDLTERKRAEEALRLSEAKFSGIVSIAADAIISIDDDQRITIFNDGAETIFGYTKAEAVGAPLDILIPERLRQVHRQHVASFAASAVTARGIGKRMTDIVGLRKNGKEFPAEAAISRLQVGDTTVLTVALRDITERRRIEKDQQFLAEAGMVLSESLDYEQTLATVARLVVQNVADWCVVEVVDENGQLKRLKVACADPAKQPLCALLEHMPLDRDLPHFGRTVIAGKRAFVIEQVTRQYIESQTQGPEHLRLLLAANIRSVMGVPLLVRGQPLGALLFANSPPSRVFDTSDLRLAQALGDRAAMAIENARLYRAAVQATQLREQVLGVVAHDLRNPLNTILVQTSAAQRRGSEPERRTQKPSEIIQRAATRMSHLIQDLLDVARMEAGLLPIEETRLGAAELIAEAVEMQRPLAASSSLDVRLAASDLSEVWGDHDRLLQAFENLIGNAIKCTPAGGRIAVGADSREDEVVFWVADTGSGIPPESLPLVFDRFWQAKRGGRGGAGLGLAITKGIVEAHRGRIWVESTVGQGTTFFFTIPKVPRVGDRPADAAQYH